MKNIAPALAAIGIVLGILTFWVSIPVIVPVLFIGAAVLIHTAATPGP